MNLTSNTEDYLKALFHLTSDSNEKRAGTNQLAEYLGISPASVSVMLKKLKDQDLVKYQKYGKIELSARGYDAAIGLIRKHRLWETFLHEHMNFSWDEVHEVAHQLEHIHSDKLVEELDNFLGRPEFDPHGHVIPDREGNFEPLSKRSLADLKQGQKCRLVSVRDSSASFLKYVTQLGLALSSEIEIGEVRDFDASVEIHYDGRKESVSRKFAQNIFVEVLDSGIN